MLRLLDVINGQCFVSQAALLARAETAQGQAAMTIDEIHCWFGDQWATAAGAGRGAGSRPARRLRQADRQGLQDRTGPRSGTHPGSTRAAPMLAQYTKPSTATRRCSASASRPTGSGSPTNTTRTSRSPSPASIRCRTSSRPSTTTSSGCRASASCSPTTPARARRSWRGCCSRS